MKHKDYNKKAFLLPDSLQSCSSYHAKIMSTGEYFFRIHDCITGIRLRGDLNDPQQRIEAVEKLKALSSAANDFAEFLETNYLNEMPCSESAS